MCVQSVRVLRIGKECRLEGRLGRESRVGYFFFYLWQEVCNIVGGSQICCVYLFGIQRWVVWFWDMDIKVLGGQRQYIRFFMFSLWFGSEQFSWYLVVLFVMVFVGWVFGVRYCVRLVCRGGWVCFGLWWERILLVWGGWRLEEFESWCGRVVGKGCVEWVE